MVITVYKKAKLVFVGGPNKLFCHIFGRKNLTRVGNTEWFPRVLAPNLLIDFLRGRHGEKQAGVVWLLVTGYTLELKMIVTGKQGLEKELSTQ